MNSWPLPPSRFALTEGEIHLWLARLDRSGSFLKRLEAVLSPDERRRAQRFHFEDDRRKFIAARGLLRCLLGQYLERHPADLSFAYTQYGKPVLPAGENLQFNLSHAGGLLLIGLTLGRKIGVDLERMKPLQDLEQIARRFFSAIENQMLGALPEDRRRDAFFTCWTRKEAYIKARGEGLSYPLKQFDVSLIPGKPARLLETRPDPQEASRWSLFSLSPPEGYQAAVAVEGTGGRLICWQY